MKYFLIISFQIIYIFSAYAQKRNCGTTQYLAEQIRENPFLEQTINNNELIIRNWILNSSENELQNILTIPVVVHIVYNSSIENISDNQVISQIEILNKDFRRLNADSNNTPIAFRSVAADCNIEFCLANKDPNGNTTTGITRTQTSLSSFGTNNDVKFTSSGGVDAWNTNEYLNIWVCDLGNGLLGYAQFPGGNPTTDGVVCHYRYFGDIGTASSPYELGRTATHEVGHYLNLRHIWGDANCGDDFCNDTPEQSASNGGCPNYPKTSSCSGNGQNGDMFMNYMDYTYDGCMNMFTSDQKDRMIASINNFRSGLINNNICNSDYGCTDPLALNYDSLAIFNNGSCCYNAGCTDPQSFNYDSLACFDDNSCVPFILGCLDSISSNFDPLANTNSINGGVINPYDNSLGGGFFTSGTRNLIFNSYKVCNIKSVDVFAQTSGTVTFELRDNSGAVIDDTTHLLVTGKNSIVLNFNTPIGNNLQLGISSNSNYVLYRNNSGVSYPYLIADAIEIIESSASNPLQYYYYYYNIEVESNCSNVMMPIYGCIDSSALNYNFLANTDDGSCCYISGCTDPYSINYDTNACFDDSSCIEAILGCTNINSLNYNSNANTLIAFGGALDSTIGTGGYFNGDQHLIFDSNQDCIIRSAHINSQGSNSIIFELRDNNGIVLDDTTISVTLGHQKIDLNFNVPIGNDMQLGVASGELSNIGLYRNNAGSNYVYNIGSLINITGSSATSVEYYYFFYNIEVEAICLTSNINESWICDNEYNCYDPGDGSGNYFSLLDCQSSCISTNIIENHSSKKLVKKINILGQKVSEKKSIMFYIYSDGSVDKRFLMH